MRKRARWASVELLGGGAGKGGRADVQRRCACLGVGELWTRLGRVRRILIEGILQGCLLCGGGLCLRVGGVRRRVGVRGLAGLALKR